MVNAFVRTVSVQLPVLGLLPPVFSLHDRVKLQFTKKSCQMQINSSSSGRPQVQEIGQLLKRKKTFYPGLNSSLGTEQFDELKLVTKTQLNFY
jgi:hypothetical protein